jgi:D-threo-aldose 1-dehydrogenase
MEKTAAIAAICARYGVALNVAAIQFAQAHSAVSSLVIGAISPDEIKANLTARQVQIPPALWDDLIGAGLVEAAAPRPS